LKIHISSHDSFANTYTCLAGNDHGDSSKIFVLKEKSADEITAESKSNRAADVTLSAMLLVVSVFMRF
jgi:hypothetical protein